MSAGPPVDRQRIQNFLEELGRRFREDGRVYLVGGTTLVYEGFETQTLDIELTFTLEDRHRAELIRAIRILKDELSLNVEEASPGDIIPLPGETAQTKHPAFAALLSGSRLSSIGGNGLAGNPSQHLRRLF